MFLIAFIVGILMVVSILLYMLWVVFEGDASDDLKQDERNWYD